MLHDSETRGKELTQEFFDNINCLEFENLNDCVTALLKKPKSDAEYGREIKKRHRKNQEQVKFLENEYAKNQNWSRDFIKELATKLELKDH